jgi:uncharacterized protein YlaN (UPF0358 family)
MLIKLTYSGHYPSKYVDVTEAEYARIVELTAKRFLFDTTEGKQLIEDLEKRPERFFDAPPSVVVYC